jgi:hypothetical protein
MSLRNVVPRLTKLERWISDDSWEEARLPAPILLTWVDNDTNEADFDQKKTQYVNVFHTDRVVRLKSITHSGKPSLSTHWIPMLLANSKLQQSPRARKAWRPPCSKRHGASRRETSGVICPVSLSGYSQPTAKLAEQPDKTQEPRSDTANNHS